MKVLVTGATGALGTRLVPALQVSGHAVRAMSRQPRSSGDVEWIRGDLRTGEGLAEAVRGVDAIIHAATHQGFTAGKMQLRKSYFHSPKTDVDGTRRLLDEAKAVGSPHVIYTSIVGIDRVSMGYYKHKLEAEAIVRSSGLPFSIPRITQFHYLLEALIRYAARFPIAMLPLAARYQPIDERDAAPLVVGLLDKGPASGVVEFGGPEEHTMEVLAKTWSAARGVRKRFRSMPVPGAKAMAAGVLCTPDRSGTITWEQWLKETST